MQAVPDLGGLDPHVSADIRQSGRRVIRYFFLRQNCAEDLVLQVFVGGQCPEQYIQHSFLLVLRNIALNGSCTAQNSGNPQQFLRLQRTAPFCPFQGSGTVCNIAKDRISLSGTQVRSGCGLLKHQLHFLQIGSRPDTQTGFLAANTAGTGGQLLQNLIQFQFQQRFLV